MEFTAIEWSSPTLAATEIKDVLLQWNLDQSLEVGRYRYSGASLRGSVEEYTELVVELLKYMGAYGLMGINGSVESPVGIDCTELGLTKLSMDMFNKLEAAGIVSPTGNIRGCFEEVYHEITIQDKLRELLINEDSENSTTFTISEQNELLYQLFKIFVMGGTLCQSDEKIERYLDTTKRFYKDVLTVYKNATTGQPEIAGKAFMVRSLKGVELFGSGHGHRTVPDSVANALIVIVDPSKHFVTVVKKVMTPFW